MSGYVYTLVHDDAFQFFLGFAVFVLN